MIIKAIAAVCFGTAMILPALADEPPPANEANRYIFNKVADGFVRLDTTSGEVSLCGQRTVGWACVAAPDDRRVLENEIARLRSENAALKKDLVSRGLALPPGATDTPPVVADRDVVHLPRNRNIDRVMTFVGHVWHRLVEAIANAQRQVLHKS